MNSYFKIFIYCSIVIFIFIVSYYIYKYTTRPPSDVKNICSKNLYQCGTGCYDKTKESCDSKNKICKIDKYLENDNLCCNDDEEKFEITSVDSKGDKKIIGYTCCNPEYWSSSGNICCPKKPCNDTCCLDNKYCNHLLDKDACIDCPTKLCPDIDGGKCCQEGEKCYYGPTGATGVYSQVCCNPELWDPEKKICCIKKDNCIPGGSTGYIGCNCNTQQTCIGYKCCDDIYTSDGNNKYSCVNEMGENICCNAKNEKELLKKCFLIDNGKYMCCNDGHVFNKDSKKCGIPCGYDICDTDTQNSFTIGEKDCICVNKGCEWTTYTYTPSILKDSKNRPIDICYNQDNMSNIKKYYTVYNPIDNIDSGKLFRTAETSESDEKNLCGKNECLEKINEKGGEIISYDQGNCYAKFNCDKVLSDLNTNPNCPYDTNISSCCYQNNKYTGQICLDNQTCYSGDDTDYIKKGDCICSNDNDDPVNKNCKFFSRNKYCNGHGDPDFKTGKCVCDPNYLESSNCKDYNPCLNGGTWDGHQCHCQAGLFAGSNCQYCRNAGDKCVKNCSGNGIPQDDGSCICDPNVIGNNCEITRASRCSSKGNPDYAQKINSDGTTVIDKTRTYCKCDGGYTGNSCEYPSNICEPGQIADLTSIGRDWSCMCFSSGGVYYNDKPPFCKQPVTCQSWCLQNFPPSEYQQCIANCHM
jgi:hypothetical protein